MRDRLLGAAGRRTGLALLLCEPLLEVVLLVATALDLKNGAEPGWARGLAALYSGCTVGHGHRTVKWLDGHAAHRFGGAPKPAGPPRYGMARARHETRVWLGTPAGAAAATVLLQLAVRYVGDASRLGPLESWRTTAWQVAGIHGLIILTYWLWPKKAPAARRAGAASPAGASARRPVPTGCRRSPCWRCGPG